MTPDFVNHTKLVSRQEAGPEGERWAIAQNSAAYFQRQRTRQLPGSSG